MRKQRFSQASYPYFLLAPALIILVLIIFYPILYSIYLSFNNYVLIKPKEIQFIGLQNYVKLLKDEVFRIALWKSVVWTFWVISIELVLGIIGAWLLNREFKGRNLVRAVVLLPWVFPSVLTGLMWVWMLDDTYGVINDILYRIGLINGFVPWMAQSSTALYGIIVTQIWHGTPFFLIMILAAFQSIPDELYEAARIDGANLWQEFRFVSWPMILPTVLITTLLRTIWTANYVEIIQIMTEGGPGYSSLTLPIYAFRKAYSSLDFGYSSALSLVLVALLAVLVWLYMRLLKKRGSLIG
ncbi:ABC transporter permease subunit [candidate division KSB3 bacterium]|uniref:ABC transporter permease subunit n=1 Tax=candidate division KSB3 bacterium TaxID=2044937 RepID=A0A9D5Q4I2_9BACT|nr:ABC transporter permease subunit [candidate division KSB3 bacterium]MBD3323293.1 ABC transporter permease subunit [candidate division KSB3 bacterium]